MSNREINYIAMRLLCLVLWSMTLVILVMYLAISFLSNGLIEKSMFTYILTIISLLLYGIVAFYIWRKTEKIVDYLNPQTKDEEGLAGFFSLLIFIIGIIIILQAVAFILQWISMMGISYDGKSFMDRLSSFFTFSTINSRVIFIILGVILMKKSKKIAGWIKINRKEVNSEN